MNKQYRVKKNQEIENILKENTRNYDAYYGLATAIYNSSKKKDNADKMQEVLSGIEL